MSGGARKHGAHRVHLGSIDAAVAGSATDTSASIFIYDAYAEGGTLAGPSSGYDGYVESVIEAAIATYATLTGQATNYAGIRLTQARSGVTVNQILVNFSGSGVVSTALVPMNYAVAAGAVVPGAGTGTMLVPTGTALPWKLQPGDTVTLDRLSNTSTGLATPDFSGTLTIAGKGA